MSVKCLCKNCEKITILFVLSIFIIFFVKFAIDSTLQQCFSCYTATWQCPGVKFEVLEIWYRCYSPLATIRNFLQTEIISLRPDNQSLNKLWKWKWNFAFLSPKSDWKVLHQGLLSLFWVFSKASCKSNQFYLEKSISKILRLCRAFSLTLPGRLCGWEVQLKLFCQALKTLNTKFYRKLIAFYVLTGWIKYKQCNCQAWEKTKSWHLGC